MRKSESNSDTYAVASAARNGTYRATQMQATGIIAQIATGRKGGKNVSKNEERQTRIIIRRLNRQAAQDRLLTAKILALWLLCAFAVFLVAMAFKPYPDTLFWVLIEAICLVVAAVVMVLATLNEIERLKKSPRNGHSKRGHR